MMEVLTEFWTYFWAHERFPLFKEVLAIQLLVLAALGVWLWLTRDRPAKL